MFSKNKIKIIASLLFTFTLLAVIIVIMSSSLANDILKGRIESQFLSESSSRGDAIRLLLETYLNQINYLAYRLSLDNELRESLLSKIQEKQGLSNDINKNQSILRQKVNEYGISLGNSTIIKNIKIMDSNGGTLLELNPNTVTQRTIPKSDIANKIPYQNEITSNKSTASIEWKKLKDEDRQLITITIPFEDKVQHQQQHQQEQLPQPSIYPMDIQGLQHLLFSATLDTDAFNKILLNRKGLGQSGEVYLVNSNKMMVSESRFFNNTQTITVDTLPVRKCFESNNGGDLSGIYNDYRNIPIIGFSYCAKDLGVVLLAEIDREEALQPIENLRNSMITMSGAIGLILTFVSIVVVQMLLSWNKKLETANKQLKEKDKMQREFINVAAHELRTPLQPILVLAELLSQGIKDNEQIHLLDIISRNAKKLKKLSDDILDITKIESNTLSLNKEQFSLDMLILGIIKDFENHLSHKQIKFEYNNLVNNCTLLADKNRISQVLSNLIGNSVKFIDGEGKISVTVEKKEDHKSNHIKSKTKNNEMIFVIVKDNGKGIDKEIMPKLFAKFVTKSFQGTGLGLYISKKIIEAHGGSLSAENNPDGNGATFTFSLPLMKQ
ncbi:MAG TPA: HAMP domain-containing sensor histidine kinase [Candidatus Nitrosocosmicus sp.]|nr:HAMP domain-containing sensor histidine kinase [Candidatus Nitrosocosmicus sp.]